jgi:hypothetical protein
VALNCYDWAIVQRENGFCYLSIDKGPKKKGRFLNLKCRAFILNKVRSEPKGIVMIDEIDSTIYKYISRHSVYCHRSLSIGYKKF